MIEKPGSFSTTAMADAIVEEQAILSSNEALKLIEPWDKSVEIVGYVIEIDRLRQDPNKSSRMSLMIGNGAGSTVKVTAWKEVAEEIHRMKLNVRDLIHIENGEAKPFGRGFECSSLGVEIHLNTGAIVVREGEYRGPMTESVPADNIKLGGLESSSSKRIKLNDVYIKNLPHVSGDRIAATFTDGVRKIDANLIGFSEFTDGLSKGEAVEIEGEVKVSGGRLELNVYDVSHIAKRDGDPLPKATLINAATPVRKRSLQTSSTISAKKPHS